MDLHQVKRLYYTLSNLKFKQVFYQIKYRIVIPKRHVISSQEDFARIGLIDFPKKKKTISINRNNWIFSFLNLEQSFSLNELNWSFGKYGMLWTYNLNYFDWLCQPGISKEQGLKTLSHFYSTPVKKNPIILHPYPTSLRIINTAKFISKWDVKENWLYNELLSDLKFLSGRLEYHLLANHLLENAFALYIGGMITNRKEFSKAGKKLLIRELNVQILDDGMHYERSPMYHLIILDRLLDALNVAKSCNDYMEFVLKSYAIKMTGLAKNWKDLNRIPMMQDSAYDIALSVASILEYSKRLLGKEFPPFANQMKDSGYRILKSGHFNLFINVGSISPSYQPGHAHADELNFELFYKGYPIIVDTGVSTYEKNQRRLLERSTMSHNCVEAGNSSDVWSGFRVGSRAKVTIISEDSSGVKAEHDGYSFKVSRKYDTSVEGEILIEDGITSTSSASGYFGKGYLHFHPDVEVELVDEKTVLLNQSLLLTFNAGKINSPSLSLGEYQYACGYNKLIPSNVISYTVFGGTKINIYEAS